MDVALFINTVALSLKMASILYSKKVFWPIDIITRTMVVLMLCFIPIMVEVAEENF
jgi:hypothetical protein